MNKKEEELKKIAKAYCEKMGYTFIFANDYKFGFEDKNEQLWTMNYMELYEALQNKNEKK